MMIVRSIIMVVKSLKFTFFFLIALIAMQWIFRPTINWLEIISMSFIAFLFYLLFEWIDQRHSR